ESVNGFGINPGTVIAGISGNTVTLSGATAAVASGTTAMLTFGAPLAGTTNTVTTTGATTLNSATVTLATTAGLYPGMIVSGSGIPSGDYISAVASATTLTLGVAASAKVATDTLTFASPSLLNYSNLYSGGTIVDQGTLSLSGTLGSTQIPGNLTMAGGNVTEVTNAGQIASTSNVTINGFGTLTLVGNNTLGSLTFNGTGGAAVPTVTGGTLVLSGSSITAMNNNLGFTPTIASNLELAGSNVTINTSGSSPNSLEFTGVIQNVMGGTANPAGLILTGTGAVALTKADTYNGSTQLNGGTLILGIATVPATAGSPLISTSTGPVGIGTLIVGGGTTIQTDGTARTISNPVTVNGSFTFGGDLVGDNVTLVGQANLGSRTPTITVTSPAVTGALSGGIVGSGGLTKAGPGVLVFGGVGDNLSGPITVNGGILQFGVAQVLPGADVSVAAGAVLNMSSGNQEIGSLAGAGLVINNAASAVVLTAGADNASTTFSGLFSATTPADLALTKIGTGTLTLTANNQTAATTSPTGALIVNQGGLTLSGNGAVLFSATDTVNGTGTITLDNTSNNIVNRLDGHALTLQGGTLVYNGTNVASTNSSETFSTLLVQNGGGTITLNGGSGGTTTVTATALTAEAVASGGSLLIQGVSGTAGTGLANLVAPAAGIAITGVTQGTGAANGNGLPTMAIRPDMIGDLSSTGTGTGFIVRDSVSGFLRPMTTSEMTSTLASSSTTNYGNFSAAQTYAAATSINSLTLDTAFGLNSTGGGQAVQTVSSKTVAQDYTSAAVLNLLTVNTGGILATASNTLNVGALTAGLGTVQLEFQVTAGAVLNLNGYIEADSGGLVKAQGGTLNLNNAEYYAGATTVNGGTLLLNSGAANTLLVTPTATVPTVYNLVVNDGGTLRLNGSNQAVGAISNDDTVGGTGGTITSTLAANLITDSATAATFGGAIGGAISFYKENTSTLILTGTNSYNGTTNVIGGGLTLQDSGTLASTNINVNGATLTINDAGLSSNSQRISSTASLNMNGGTFTMAGASYTTTAMTIGAVNVLTGTTNATVTVSGLSSTAGLYVGEVVSGSGIPTGDTVATIVSGSSVTLTTAANSSGSPSLTFGAGVTATTGLNTFTVTPPAATTNNSADLTIGDLTRTTGAATVFTGAGLGSSLPGAAQIFVSNVNSVAPAFSNNILAGWATTGSTAALSDNWATIATAQTLSVATTFNSNAVTLASGTTAQMVVGQQVSGGAIPSGAYITAINGLNSITISQNASVTETANTTFANGGVIALNSNAYTTLGAGAPVATANYTTTATTTTVLSGAIQAMNSLQFNGAATVAQSLDIGGPTNVLSIGSGGIMRTSIATTG
ncbi:MAG TPA: autotransporter-associated beta strand repeat-containing protein, partial [Pirellulales bacterium]